MLTIQNKLQRCREDIISPVADTSRGSDYYKEEDVENAFISLSNMENLEEVIDFLENYFYKCYARVNYKKYIPSLVQLLDPSICISSFSRTKVGYIINDISKDLRIYDEMVNEYELHKIIWPCFPNNTCLLLLSELIFNTTPSLKSQRERNSSIKPNSFRVYNYLLSNNLIDQVNSILTKIGDDSNPDDFRYFFTFVRSLSCVAPSITDLVPIIDQLIDMIQASSNDRLQCFFLDILGEYAIHVPNGGLFFSTKAEFNNLLIGFPRGNEVVRYIIRLFGKCTRYIRSFPNDFPRMILDYFLSFIENGDPYLDEALIALVTCMYMKISESEMVLSYCFQIGLHYKLMEMIETEQNFYTKEDIAEAICNICGTQNAQIISVLVDQGLIDFIEKYMCIMPRCRKSFVDLLLDVFAAAPNNSDWIDRIFENTEISEYIEEIASNYRDNDENLCLTARAVLQYDSFQ